ncbi:MAG TPA: hypothetical protein VGB44_03575 [Flavobacterium sp.]|jgi:hypothetical protein
MELHIKIIGILLIALALLHVIFPKYFNWKEELQRISLINRQVMIIHTFFIAFVLLLMGLLCFTSADELVETPLGRKVALGLSIFWITRLVIQFVGYSSELWKGKRFETAVHILFSAIWIYLSVVFSITAFGQ